jgi:hypothetical protein
MRILAATLAITSLLFIGEARAQDKQEEEIKKEETVPKSGSAGGQTEPDQNAKQEGSSKIPGLDANTPILVDGRLTVPGASDGDAVPSKYSARTFADDQLPIAAYGSRHLTKENLQTIRNVLMLESDASGSRALGGFAEIGAMLPLAVALQGMQSFPLALVRQMPSLAASAYVMSESKILLVNPRTRVVIGVID